MCVSSDALNACDIKSSRASYRNGLRDLNMIFRIRSYVQKDIQTYIYIFFKRFSTTASLGFASTRTHRMEKPLERKPSRVPASLRTASRSAHPVNVAQHLDIISAVPLWNAPPNASLRELSVTVGV